MKKVNENAFTSKIRIKDIAQRANVSVGTVDRVLHNRGEVANETKDLINSIIKELEYKPNAIASVLSMKKPFVLAIFIPLPQKQNSYWQMHLSGIEEAVRDMNFIDIKPIHFFYEINSRESISIQFEQLLETRPDAVVMVPAFDDFHTTCIAKLQENLIPVVSIDLPLAGEYSIDSIQQDSYQEGYVAGRLMSYGVSKEITVLIINIGSELHCNPHCLNRIKGFKDFLKDNNITETKVRTINIPSTDEADVKKFMNDAFLDYSFVRGLFISGSEVHRIAKFVNDRKLGNIRIIGFELLESNVAYLKKGVVDFLITQKPNQLGYLGTSQIIHEQALKRTKRPHKSIPIDIITTENVDYHIQ